MTSVVDGMLRTGAERRPFPKPIRDVIPSLLEDARLDNRWLEWGADPSAPMKMSLTLVTLGERRNRCRRLWGTWERPEAAGMEWSLKLAGVQVFGGRNWDLDWYDGERFALWYMPEAATCVTPEMPRGLLSVFGDAMDAMDAMDEGGRRSGAAG